MFGMSLGTYTERRYSSKTEYEKTGQLQKQTIVSGSGRSFLHAAIPTNLKDKSIDLQLLPGTSTGLAQHKPIRSIASPPG